MAAKKAPPKPVAGGAKTKGGAIPLDPNSKTSQAIAKKTEANLSPKQKARADEFVLQYLVDFNATRAFIRMKGELDPFDEVDLNYASNAGYQMTRWPYVAQRIEEAMREAEQKNIVSVNDVLFGLKREAHYHGVGASHSARVGSWGKLATILGMDQKKVEQNLAMRGGVMIVPATDNLEDWESRAASTQAALKEEVRK